MIKPHMLLFSQLSVVSSYFTLLHSSQQLYQLKHLPASIITGFHSQQYAAVPCTSAMRHANDTAASQHRPPLSAAYQTGLTCCLRCEEQLPREARDSGGNFNSTTASTSAMVLSGACCAASSSCCFPLSRLALVLLSCILITINLNRADFAYSFAASRIPCCWNPCIFSSAVASQTNTDCASYSQGDNRLRLGQRCSQAWVPIEQGTIRALLK
jgi:hypothetical protein